MTIWKKVRGKSVIQVEVEPTAVTNRATKTMDLGWADMAPS
jgi:hypothetical protein